MLDSDPATVGRRIQTEPGDIAIVPRRPPGFITDGRNARWYAGENNRTAS